MLFYDIVQLKQHQVMKKERKIFTLDIVGYTITFFTFLINYIQIHNILPFNL